MSIVDPFILIAAISVVALLLTPLASRLIADAAAQLSIERGSHPEPDLSRIRPRRRPPR